MATLSLPLRRRRLTPGRLASWALLGLATVLVLLSHIGATGVAVFNTLILMIGIAAAIPYGFSALAQIKWRIADRRTVARSRLARDVITQGRCFSAFRSISSTDPG